MGQSPAKLATSRWHVNQAAPMCRKRLENLEHPNRFKNSGTTDTNHVAPGEQLQFAMTSCSLHTSNWVTTVTLHLGLKTVSTSSRNCPAAWSWHNRPQSLPPRHKINTWFCGVHRGWLRSNRTPSGDGWSAESLSCRNATQRSRQRSLGDAVVDQC